MASFPSTPQLISDSHRAGVELQIIDLALAHSLLDSADILSNSDVVRRLRRQAKDARDSALRYLATLRPTAAQQSQIDALLASLEARLVGSRSNPLRHVPITSNEGTEPN